MDAPVKVKGRSLRGIVLLIGLAALLPWSVAATGDGATFAQHTLARDLPMPKPDEATDDPAYCDDIGHAVRWQMLTTTGWDNTSYLGACLARPIPGSTGGLRMYAACRAPDPAADGAAATVPCGVLFVNHGKGEWRISSTQFELRETSGRPHRAPIDSGHADLLLAPGESGVLDVAFATGTGLAEPYFVTWWPEERLPPGAAQSLTIAIGI
jgi:hypothetical protein